MKNLTKKSLIISATIATLIAMVVGFLGDNYILILVAYVLNLMVIGFAHFYIDNKLDDYAREISKFSRYYDFSNIGEDFEDVGKIYRKLIKKNIGLEKKLRTETRKLSELKSIISNMEEGFIVFDGSGQVDFLNESAIAYLDIKEGVTFENLIDDKEYRLAVREAKLLSKSKSLSVSVNDYHLKVFIDPIAGDLSLGFVVIIIDYSEARKAELMRKEFSGNVTHELKSPLTSINGYAELIATGIAKDEDVKKFASIIFNEGNRLLEIIDDILRLSRLDEKAYKLDKTYVDVKEEMDKIIETYKNQADEKFLTIENRLTSYGIETSKFLFTDLLSNIYENAIKYNKDGGKIKISSILIDRSMRIFIEDTGIGIKNSDIKRVFERFFVADKSRDRKIKSTGLGLSIVKHIADFLGMEVSVESKFKEGTKFIIDIPIDEREECLLK